MKTYPLVSDEHYGWFTGVAKDGRLVLVDHDMNIFFDDQGALIEIEVIGTYKDWSDSRERDFHARAKKLIATTSRIFVQSFESSDPEVSVRPIPKNSDLFEFKIGNDFWMNPDGTVNSS